MPAAWRRICTAHNWTTGLFPILSGCSHCGGQSQAHARNLARLLFLQSSSCYLRLARLDKRKRGATHEIVPSYCGTLSSIHSATTLVDHSGETHQKCSPIVGDRRAKPDAGCLFYHWKCACSGNGESPQNTTANVVESAKNTERGDGIAVSHWNR